MSMAYGRRVHFYATLTSPNVIIFALVLGLPDCPCRSLFYYNYTLLLSLCRKEAKPMVRHSVYRVMEWFASTIFYSRIFSAFEYRSRRKKMSGRKKNLTFVAHSDASNRRGLKMMRFVSRSFCVVYAWRGQGIIGITNIIRRVGPSCPFSSFPSTAAAAVAIRGQFHMRH